MPNECSTSWSFSSQSRKPCSVFRSIPLNDISLEQQTESSDIIWDVF